MALHFKTVSIKKGKYAPFGSALLGETNQRIRQVIAGTNPTVKFTINERWLARINLPMAILNILAVATMDPKDRRPSYYVSAAASAYNIYDFIHGPSVAKAREKFTNLLIHCKTPEQIIKVLIDNQILNEGGMSFLNEWIKDRRSVGVRVGRTGSAILYKDRLSSFGGPYPIQLFPQQPKKVAPVVQDHRAKDQARFRPR